MKRTLLLAGILLFSLPAQAGIISQAECKVFVIPYTEPGPVLEPEAEVATSSGGDTCTTSFTFGAPGGGEVTTFATSQTWASVGLTGGPVNSILASVEGQGQTNANYLVYPGPYLTARGWTMATVLANAAYQTSGPPRPGTLSVTITAFSCTLDVGYMDAQFTLAGYSGAVFAGSCPIDNPWTTVVEVPIELGSLFELDLKADFFAQANPFYDLYFDRYNAGVKISANAFELDGAATPIFLAPGPVPVPEANPGCLLLIGLASLLMFERVFTAEARRSDSREEQD